MENKLWIMYCGCPHKGFVKRYATRRAVMRAVCYARKKVPFCCTDERYKIGWVYDFAQEAIVNQATNIVNQSKEM